MDLLEQRAPGTGEIPMSLSHIGKEKAFTVKNYGPTSDMYARRPTLSNAYGGLSGPAIKPIGVRAVYDVYMETSKEIIGCGGISNFEDVIEYMMAGARAVEVGTALRTAGRAIFDNIKRDIIRFMEAEGLDGIQEIIGAGVKR